jgi:Zn-finger nucleic acid-binding protein
MNFKIKKSMGIISLLLNCILLAACKTTTDESSIKAAETQSPKIEKVFPVELGVSQNYPKFVSNFSKPTADSFRNWAYCGDNGYLIGLSENKMILCVQDGIPSIDPAQPIGYIVQKISINSRLFGSSFDWASGRQKLECLKGDYVAGLVTDSDRGIPNTGILGIYCAHNVMRRVVEDMQKCRTVWFDRGEDSRPIGDTRLRQIDFDFASAKGQCARGEYTAGVAYFDEWVWHRHKPHAILCCPFS